MKTVTKAAFQGDVMFERVGSLPRGLVEEKTAIVAHSETGHHHVIEGGKFKLFRQDSMTCFLSLQEPVQIVHKRPWDTHEALGLAKGVWKIRRQREWAPEGWRQVVD